MQENKKELVENQLTEFYKARDELYELFDKVIPKLNESELYNLQKCECEILKQIYKKFYKYDYEARKFQPILQKYYEGN